MPSLGYDTEFHAGDSNTIDYNNGTAARPTHARASTRGNRNAAASHTAVDFFFEYASFIRAKRVSNCYIQKKKSAICACVRLILVLVGKKIVRVFD